MGVPTNHPFINGFSIVNHPAIGLPPFVETPHMGHDEDFPSTFVEVMESCARDEHGAWVLSMLKVSFAVNNALGGQANEKRAGFWPSHFLGVSRVMGLPQNGWFIVENPI